MSWICYLLLILIRTVGFNYSETESHVHHHKCDHEHHHHDYVRFHDDDLGVKKLSEELAEEDLRMEFMSHIHDHEPDHNHGNSSDLSGVGRSYNNKKSESLQDINGDDDGKISETTSVESSLLQKRNTSTNGVGDKIDSAAVNGPGINMKFMIEMEPVQSSVSTSGYIPYAVARCSEAVADLDKKFRGGGLELEGSRTRVVQHNFTDGMALGSAFLLYGSVGGWSRTLFLLAHELPQEDDRFSDRKRTEPITELHKECGALEPTGPPIRTFRKTPPAHPHLHHDMNTIFFNKFQQDHRFES